MTYRLLIASTAVLLAANCTGSTNPETATLFDNVRNLNSGEYNRQIRAKEAEAAAIVRSNNQRRSNISSLESQRQANAGQIASLRGQISSVRAEIAQARAAGADPARLNQLSSQVNAVQSDVNNGADPSVVRSELSRIRTAVRSLSA